MSSPYSSELRKVAEREKPFMEKLNSDDQNQQWEAICEIRNAIVGNRRQKVSFFKDISIFRTVSNRTYRFAN